MDAGGLDQLVRSARAEVTNKFVKVAKAARNEREFQTAATQIIDEFAGRAGVDLPFHEEYTLLNGRADAVYNRFIIEYEAPGSLRDKNSYGHNQHAIGQVKDYLTALARRERHKAERLAAVVFNGDFYIWVRQREKSWYIDDPVAVRPETTERFLRTLCSLSTERALIPENLIEDFGENANVSRQVVAGLYRALTSPHPRRVTVLFQQWSRQFSEVCDYDQASRVNVGDQARSYGIKEKNVQSFEFFFCLHTYYALLIKLLALQIVHFYLMPKLGTDLRQAAAKPSEELRKYLGAVENGGIFRQLGINNLMEGDFFGWYLDCWSESVEGVCRGVIDTLGNYAADTLDIDPDVSRDLLKNLYQNLMPKQLRHNLGEYYTPDWLAERTLGLLDGAPEETVRQVEGAEKSTRINVYRGDPRKRLLDPACGSGTFLVMAIKRIKQYAWRHTMNEREVLELILQNVVGFDLNPLAVISARTNYLLALGDLLQHRRGEINIPVYLCDSILTPSDDVFIPGNQPTLGLRTGRYSFPTAVGTFAIPASLVSAQSVDVLANLLEESVTMKLSLDQFARKASQVLSLDPEKAQDDTKLVTELYGHLRKLDGEGINGIWARIIKNAFAPVFSGRFDLVAGNPPWVNWSSLPEEYRTRTRPVWSYYGLFTHAGLRARLGSAMDDISILLTYVAADRYLSARGRLGFVITQTILKSEGGGQGFRRLRLANREWLQVVWVDDFSSIQVFDGPSNRTAIIILSKGRQTRFPVAYGYWRKVAHRQSLPTDAPLTHIISLTSMSIWRAQPIRTDEPTSPWFTGRGRAYEGVRKLVGEAPYQARMGVHCHGNGAYWLEFITQRPNGPILVRNIAEAGRSEIDSVEASLETEFVYPLLRGKDVQQWRAKSELLILVPHSRQSPAVGVEQSLLQEVAPKTLAYLTRFEAFLRARSGYRQFFSAQRAPFWSMYNVGPYTFAPYKVVWRYIAGDFTTAVVSSASTPWGENKLVIPETKLVLIPFQSETEAHFVCAQLASSPARFLVMSYIVNIQMATHVMKYVKLQRYNPKATLHMELAKLSREAHGNVRADEGEASGQIQTRIDELATVLWGLSRRELNDMIASLAELRGGGT